ncbi:MAG: pilus assembly PilX family protein, partial [Pseudomonadales bacterium]
MHSGISIHKQNGAVLLVSLIILVIMTVIGTSGITSVTLEERMVSNMYDDNLSFQAGETGLRDCEDYISQLGIDRKQLQGALGGGSAPDATTEFWESDDSGSANAPASIWTGATGLTYWWQDTNFWVLNGMQYSTTDATQTDLMVLANGAVAANPRCIREEVDFQADDKQESVLSKTGWYHYQATAAATG